jgi:hypothetical protein
MDKGRKGAVLVLTLLVMFVGGIILGGLFMYLDTSLLLATRGEENAVNYYAADSGIEDALYWLQHGQEDQAWWDCDMDKEQCERDGYTLNYTNYADNNRTVNVSVVKDPYDSDTSVGNSTYLITSTATNKKSGASTKIESYVRAVPLEFMKWDDAAITSNCSVYIQQGIPGGMINGSVNYACTIACGGDGADCPIDAEEDADPMVPQHECCDNKVIDYADNILPYPDGITWWPETWATIDFFSSMAEDQDAFHIDGDFEIDLVNPLYANLGPLYIEGNLLIKSSSKDIERTTLNGILYVTGDLIIGGAKEFILDLNDQVIFVEGKGENTYDIYIDEDCSFEGSGAIITIGDIYFQPKMLTEDDEFVMIMSLEGTVDLHPSGTFYGSINGYYAVDVSPNNAITQVDGDAFWNSLPNNDENIIKILTYDIIDQ